MTEKARNLLIATIIIVTLLGIVTTVNFKSRKGEFDNIERQFLSHDIDFYWVGEVPYNLKGISKRINRAEAGSLSDANMPSSRYQGYVTVAQPMGNGQTNYKLITSDTLVVVYKVDYLSPSDKDVIYRCVQNGIPVLAIGEDCVKQVKSAIGRTDDASGAKSYFYSLNKGAVSDPMDPKMIMPYDWDIEFLTFVMKSFGYPAEG